MVLRRVKEKVLCVPRSTKWCSWATEDGTRLLCPRGQLCSVLSTYFCFWWGSEGSIDPVLSSSSEGRNMASLGGSVAYWHGIHGRCGSVACPAQLCEHCSAWERGRSRDGLPLPGCGAGCAVLLPHGGVCQQTRWHGIQQNPDSRRIRCWSDAHILLALVYTLTFLSPQTDQCICLQFKQSLISPL